VTRLSAYGSSTLRYVRDGGQPYKQPLVVLFAGATSVLSFFATVAVSVALVSPFALMMAHPWRPAQVADGPA
jgi:hypothetical protein